MCRVSAAFKPLKKVIRQSGCRRSTTRFGRSLRRFGHRRCSSMQGALLVGLGPEGELRSAVLNLPDQLDTVAFLEGPAQIELISDFLQSPEAQQVSTLKIGTSQLYAARRPAEGFDLGKVMSLFKGRHLPNLRSLCLGDMFVLYNSPVRACRIGDITPLFDAAPNLRMLDLCGPFFLTRPVEHAHLQEVSVHVDAASGQEAVISQQTFTNLMMSKLLEVQSLSLLSDATEDVPLDLPTAFDPRAQMPKLTAFEVENLTPESQQRYDALQEVLLVG